MRDNFNLALTLLADLHDVAKVAYAAVDFNLVVKEFFKIRDVENLVRCRLRGIDDVLQGDW